MRLGGFFASIGDRNGHRGPLGQSHTLRAARKHLISSQIFFGRAAIGSIKAVSYNISTGFHRIIPLNKMPLFSGAYFGRRAPTNVANMADLLSTQNADIWAARLPHLQNHYFSRSFNSL
jgi:hypothetical protein